MTALALSGLPLAAPANAASAQGTGAVTAGDFDGDGKQDLVIGVPWEDIGGISDAGVVHVLYGSDRGPTTRGSDLWSQNKRGIRGSAAEQDNFGRALAAGDFDNDGFDDLAIGAPGEDVGGLDYSGAVHILYGSRRGLSRRGDDLFTLATQGIPGDPTENGNLGAALAAAPLGKGSAHDLAIGIPGATLGTQAYAGAASVLYGSGRGLRVGGGTYLHQNKPGVEGEADQFDGFGGLLTAANLAHNGKAELVVGSPFDEETSGGNSGSVHIFKGSRRGVRTADDELWHQDSPGIAPFTDPNPGDAFGWSLAAGNFGDGRRADLAIGIPGDEVGGDPSAGAVVVLRGTRNGLHGNPMAFMTEDSEMINGSAEQFEAFGSAVTAANLGHGRHADLVIGTPSQDVPGTIDAGVVHVLRGSTNGFGPNADELWSQGEGIKGSPGEFDNFGAGLIATNFGKGSRADLLTTSQGDDIGGAQSAGSANLIYGSSNGLRAFGDQFFHQNQRGMPEQAEDNDLFGYGKAFSPG